MQPITPSIILVRVHSRGAPRRVGDQEILASFKKARMPLGTEVTSRDVRASLPRELRSNICKRTIRNRLAERGYAPTKKVEKNDCLSKQRDPF